MWVFLFMDKYSSKVDVVIWLWTNIIVYMDKNREDNMDQPKLV